MSRPPSGRAVAGRASVAGRRASEPHRRRAGLGRPDHRGCAVRGSPERCAASIDGGMSSLRVADHRLERAGGRRRGPRRASQPYERAVEYWRREWVSRTGGETCARCRPVPAAAAGGRCPGGARRRRRRLAASARVGGGCRRFARTAPGRVRPTAPRDRSHGRGGRAGPDRSGGRAVPGGRRAAAAEWSRWERWNGARTHCRAPGRGPTWRAARPGGSRVSGSETGVQGWRETRCERRGTRWRG